MWKHLEQQMSRTPVRCQCRRKGQPEAGSWRTCTSAWRCSPDFCSHRGRPRLPPTAGPAVRTGARHAQVGGNLRAVAACSAVWVYVKNRARLKGIAFIKPGLKIVFHLDQEELRFLRCCPLGPVR